MSRAGIPVTEEVRHNETKDLWAASQEYRNALDADQANKVARRWETKPTTWTFTRETYLDGEAK